MIPILIACLLLGVCAQSEESRPSADNSPQKTVNATAFGECKSCPYDICTHRDADAILTCWTQGDLIGDTDLWLKTTSGCYYAEYDIFEYEGDFMEDLEYCGEVPLTVTQEQNTIRYLSECIWGYETGNEVITYYGRDVDITLTCWANGTEVMGDPYWYKTLGFCWISGSTLWDEPDRDSLEWCGPPLPRRDNETVEPLHTEGKKLPLPPPDEDEDWDEDWEGDGHGDESDIEDGGGTGLARRWLSPGEVSEKYAGCYSCPRFYGNETCELVKEYEFNETVVSQCATTLDLSVVWMYTTDWCYVNGTKFFTEPWHHFRYPHCMNWDL